MTAEIQRRDRLAKLIQSFRQDSLGRGSALELLLLSAVAREPLLLIAGPGAGKSMLIQRLARSFGYGVEDLFEYVLSHETLPSDLAPSQSALGRPSFPAATWVHLQELLQVNSTMLNYLLYSIDAWQRSGTTQVLIGSVYDIAELHRASGLRDRFAVKLQLDAVPDEAFMSMIQSRLIQETEMLDLSPLWNDQDFSPAESTANAEPELARFAPEDLAAIQTAYAAQLAQKAREAAATTTCPCLPADVAQTFQHLIKSLVREDRVFVSDRKIYKLYKLMQARAWLLGKETIGREDLILLSYLGETREELTLLREKVPILIARA